MQLTVMVIFFVVVLMITRSLWVSTIVGRILRRSPLNFSSSKCEKLLCNFSFDIWHQCAALKDIVTLFNRNISNRSKTIGTELQAGNKVFGKDTRIRRIFWETVALECDGNLTNLIAAGQISKYLETRTTIIFSLIYNGIIRLIIGGLFQPLWQILFKLIFLPIKMFHRF